MKDELRACAAACGGALALCALLVSIARADSHERWVTIATKNPNATFHVDLGSVTRNGDVVTFRERLVFANPDQRDQVSGKVIKEKRVTRVMNCVDNSQGVKSGSVFDDKGKLIELVTVEEQKIEMFPIPPGTVAAQELKLACEAKSAAPAPNTTN